jgi:hypothetical protein
LKGESREIHEFNLQVASYKFWDLRQSRAKFLMLVLVSMLKNFISLATDTAAKTRGCPRQREKLARTQTLIMRQRH